MKPSTNPQRTSRLLMGTEQVKRLTFLQAGWRWSWSWCWWWRQWFFAVNNLFFWQQCWQERFSSQQLRLYFLPRRIFRKIMYMNTVCSTATISYRRRPDLPCMRYNTKPWRASQIPALIERGNFSRLAFRPSACIFRERFSSKVCQVSPFLYSLKQGFSNFFGPRHTISLCEI
jgi:hypothetical protein